MALVLRLVLVYYAALLVAVLHHGGRPVVAGDPDILTDFVVPPDKNASQLDGGFFTYHDLVTGNAADPAKLTVTKATAAEFPALLGQSVSYANLVFGAGTVNPPHIHPRASELLLVARGQLLVGLIDAAHNGTVYEQTLQAGDMFVFPKGMLHYQVNNGSGVATAFSAFGGASPGTILMPVALFESGIDDAVLEKSFRTDQATVDALEQDNQLPPPPAAPAPSMAAARLLSRGGGLLSFCGAAAIVAMAL